MLRAHLDFDPCSSPSPRTLSGAAHPGHPARRGHPARAEAAGPAALPAAPAPRRISALLGVLGLALTLGPLGSAPAGAQEPSCASATFSATLEAQVPDPRRLCVLVTELEDTTLAVVRAEVARPPSNGALEIRFVYPNGQRSERRIFAAPPELRVRTNAGVTTVRALRVGQPLSLFLDTQRPEIALEPEADDAPLQMEVLSTPANVATPGRSQSQAPTGVLLGGALVLLVGGALAALRIRSRTA